LAFGMSENFSDRLRQIIAKAGISTSQFALRCGVPQRVLSYYEHGRKPTAEAALRIARAANVSLEWLISGEEPPTDAIRSIDVEKLKTAIEIVEDILKTEQIELDTGKKAEIITLVCQDLCVLSTSGPIVKRRALSLVKSAA